MSQLFIASIVCSFALRLTISPFSLALALQFHRSLSNGLEYPQIPGAPAQVAAHVSQDFFVGSVYILVKQRFRREDHAWCAKPTLEGEIVEKSLLQRMQMAGAIREPFNRGRAYRGFRRRDKCTS